MLGRRLSVFYGWVIVVVAFVASAITTQARFSFAVFYVAMLQEFGWSRASGAGAYALHMLVHALSAPLIGALGDRFGIRRVIPVGALAVALGISLISRMNSIWQLYLLFGIVTSLGVSSVGFVSVNTLLSKWFVDKRGKAVGITMAGGGIGSLVLTPFIQFLIANWGWRRAYVWLAAMVALIVAPLTRLVYRSRPEEMGLLPDGLGPIPGPRTDLGSIVRSTTSRKNPNSSRDYTLPGAVQTIPFWLVFGAALMAGFSRSSMVVHQIAYMVDIGYPEMLASAIFGVAGLMVSIGNVLAGHVADIKGKGATYIAGAGLMLAGISSLVLLRDPFPPWMLYAYATLYGLGFGAHAPVNVSLQADLFGGNHFGSIHGCLVTAFGLGGAIGPWVSGLIFDITGSYLIAFIAVMIAIAGAATGIWLADRQSRFSRSDFAASSP